MSVRDELRALAGTQLAERLAKGSAVDPDRIVGFAYRGTSLGLPAFAERLSWVSFQKTFMRDEASGRTFGWNVRLEQTGLHGPSTPRRNRDGSPKTWGAYEVYPAAAEAPRAYPEGALMIDYSRALSWPLASVRFVRDPLVSLSGPNGDVLLGWSYVDIGISFSTPSYFLLEREAPIDHEPPDSVRRAIARAAPR